MGEVLYRAASYLLIIVFGIVFKKIGFFKDNDFKTLSKIMLYITLPCAIIYNFSSVTFETSMLVLTGLGILTGLIFIGAAYLEGKLFHKEREIPFDMINFSGYNIGNFSMPFAQSFFGPIGVVTISLFDMGNAFICNGGSKAFAQLIKARQEGADLGGSPLGTLWNSVRTIASVLVRSAPFMTYLVMISMTLLHIGIPQMVVHFTGIVSQANAFVAMLMIGVGFKLNIKKDGISHVIRILISRYLITACFIAVTVFFLPFDFAVKQALIILLVAPIASADPAFTESLGEDYELASTVNSIAVVIGILCTTLALLLVL